MKNLFIVKRIVENMNLSDNAFSVWCGLRNIMHKDQYEYFITYNMIAYSVFKHHPTRKEYEAIKNGFLELVENKYVTVLDDFSKNELLVDLSNLYYNGDEYFSDLSEEEMHQIMNIPGNHNKHKLLRYFTCQVGSFNRSNNMGRYKGKIGGMSLENFEEMIPITKPTIASFNHILEENELLFVIRHKDFYQYKSADGENEIREIPNTYSRWKDRKLAQEFAEEQHGYKYEVTKKGVRTDAANKNRSLGQKLNNYIYNHTEYDDATIAEMREYAEKKNARLKEKYEDDVSKGYHPEEPVYIDMTVFGAVG